jgi:hypothetical protein
MWHHAVSTSKGDLSVSSVHVALLCVNEQGISVCLICACGIALCQRAREICLSHLCMWHRTVSTSKGDLSVPSGKRHGINL